MRDSNKLWCGSQDHPSAFCSLLVCLQPLLWCNSRFTPGLIECLCVKFPWIERQFCQVMQVIKDLIALETLEYPGYSWHSLFKGMHQYKEHDICVKAQRQKVQSFQIILSKFHSNHPFTVHPHLTFYICKCNCQCSPKMFKATATEANKVYHWLPTTIRITYDLKEFSFLQVTWWLYARTKYNNILLLHKFLRLMLC